MIDPARERRAPQAREARRSASACWSPAWVQSIAGGGPVDVSVCIANWNCREHLRACLESLDDHPQGVRLETIVVDNASKDGAADMVAREFPEVLLVRNNTNVGFAQANNQAATLARGRFLFFLNNDTVVPAGALRRLVEYASAHPEVGMIGPRLRDAEGRVQISFRPRPSVIALLHRTTLLRWSRLLRPAYRRYRRQQFDPNTTRRVDVLMGAAVFMPRDVFEEMGAWDESYTFGGEDLDLCARVGRRYAVVYLPRVEIVHHGRVSTRRHLRYASAHIPAGFVRYLRKRGCSPSELLLYKLLLTLDAPVQCLEKGIQYLWRRLRGRRAAAERSRVAMSALAHFFLGGLPAFWKA